MKFAEGLYLFVHRGYGPPPTSLMRNRGTFTIASTMTFRDCRHRLSSWPARSGLRLILSGRSAQLGLTSIA